jgi:hypothetical protein
MEYSVWIVFRKVWSVPVTACLASVFTVIFMPWTARYCLSSRHRRRCIAIVTHASSLMGHPLQSFDWRLDALKYRQETRPGTNTGLARLTFLASELRRQLARSSLALR